MEAWRGGEWRICSIPLHLQFSLVGLVTEGSPIPLYNNSACNTRITFFFPEIVFLFFTSFFRNLVFVSELMLMKRVNFWWWVIWVEECGDDNCHIDDLYRILAAFIFKTFCERIARDNRVAYSLNVVYWVSLITFVVFKVSTYTLYNMYTYIFSYIFKYFNHIFL